MKRMRYGRYNINRDMYFYGNIFFGSFLLLQFASAERDQPRIFICSINNVTLCAITAQTRGKIFGLTLIAKHLLVLGLGGGIDPGTSLEFRHELESVHADGDCRCAHDGEDESNQHGQIRW